jgi:hypothetical protein
VAIVGLVSAALGVFLGASVSGANPVQTTGDSISPEFEGFKTASGLALPTVAVCIVVVPCLVE